MNTAKFELGNQHPTRNLFRVVALRDFGTVKAGEIGGWVESEENLSQHGNCWVSEDASVTGNATVQGDAQVSGNAQISDEAWVFGSARVAGNAQISGNAWVYNFVRVFGNARVSGDAKVSGDMVISGNGSLHVEDAKVEVFPRKSVRSHWWAA